MNVSMAISLLILGAAIGSQAGIKDNAKIRKRWREDYDFESPIVQAAQDASDCCFSYTSRRIRCSNFVDYFLTSGVCIHPGIIFVTRTGKHVCANPSDPRAQKCLKA